ncbi:hypothetical protein AYK81_00370 [Bacillus thuringiensis]|nr:hypothetical protein AYK81_00370 [Bacillus thuringiensis]
MLIISLLMYVSNTKWLVQLLKIVIFFDKLVNWMFDRGSKSNQLIYFFIIYNANKFFREKGVC